jgi:hypothetical protein
MTRNANPRDKGVVANREGTTGAPLRVVDKVGSNDFIIVISEDSKDKLIAYRSGKGDGDGLTPDCGGTFDDLREMVNDRPLDFLAIDDVFLGELGQSASKALLESAYGTCEKKEVVQKILIRGKYH